MSDRHRRYQHDSDDEEEVHSKRSKNENEEQIGKLENLITQLGNNATADQHESLQNNLHGLAAVLDSDISNFKQRIMDVLLNCALDRPDKLSIYSTLAGLLNLKNHAFVGELLENLISRLRKRLTSGADWQSVTTAVAFITDLTNCNVVSTASLLQFYNSLISVTLEDDIPQCRSDCFVMLALTSLPRVAETLAAKNIDELNQLMERVGNYRSRRSLTHVSALQVLDSSEQLDSLDSLWHQLVTMQRNCWKEKCLVRFEALQPLLAAAGESVHHSLPAIAPPPHEDGTRYPVPSVVFRVFDYVDVPEDSPALPGEHSIERYLIEQHLLRVLDCHIGERKDCAKRLLNCQFGVKVPLSYIIGELLIGKLLQLPKPNYLQLAYSSLLIELCKEDSDTMPNVVAQAVFNLYDKIESMNSLCCHRFASWFAYHLSQFQYKWSWSDWADDCRLPFYNGKRIFLRETVQYLIRFSFHEDMQKLLCDIDNRYADLVGTEPPECAYKYGESAIKEAGDSADPQLVEASMVARRLLDRIRRRCTPEEAIETLRQLPTIEGWTAEQLQIDVFYSTLLHLASKSFSHSFAALAKFDILCKALVPRESKDAQMHLMDTLFYCWRRHEQMLIVLVDKMVKVQILQCQHVLEFLLSPSTSRQHRSRRLLLKFFAWDIADSTLGKMCRHAAKLRQLAEQARLPGREKGEGGEEAEEEEEEEDREARQSRLKEAAKRKEEADECDRQLARVTRALVAGCFGLIDATIREGDAELNDGEGPAFSASLRRVLADRCLTVAMLHCDSILPHMRQLRHELQLETAEANSMLNEFFNKFFSLTD